MLNKKAQVGDTLTWIVATIAIVVLLMFFFFGTSALSAAKEVIQFKDSLFSKAEMGEENLFVQKSIYTFLMSDKEFVKNKIVNYYSKDEGKNIFEEKIKDLEKRI
jgi:hypothetical protein